MRSLRVRRVISVVVLGVLGVGVLTQLAACNTFKGVGRDVEAMAQGGQDFIDGKH